MPHQEAVAITINSIHRQSYVLASSNAVVEWHKALQQTGTARFRMAGYEGDWVPLVGQAFGIYDTSVPGWGDPWQLGLIFAGSIDSVAPERPAPGMQPNWLEVEVTGSSREQTLQRRLIRPFGFGYRYSRYKNMTAGAIAQAVLTDFADGENLVITPANFDDGPTIPFVAWNHQSVAEALTQLADYSEMHWWIAPDSQVYFKEREAVPAPWGIVDGGNECQRLSVRESRENLNNAVYYRTTFAAFADDPLPEFKNPSETVIVSTPGQTFFQTEMQIQEAIDIATEIPGSEGRTPQEIEQSDGTEALFWYIPGDDGFSLTTGKTLPLGAQITFHYNRLGGDVIPVEDATAISERAAVELVGSGRYELAVANTAYTSRPAAEQRASMIIQQRRNTAMVIDGETMRKGLDVGQWLVVSTSNPPINDTFLVTSVTARAVLGTREISFSFSGVNGNKLPNGWDFFTGLGDAGFGGGFGSGFQGAGQVGGAGGGAGGANLADLWREVPLGAINGTNRVFYLTYTVKPPFSLELKLNGVNQYPTSNAMDAGPITGFEYGLKRNKIRYEIAPQPGDKHEAIYWKDELFTPVAVASAVFTFVSSCIPGSGGGGACAVTPVLGTASTPGLGITDYVFRDLVAAWATETDTTTWGSGSWSGPSGSNAAASAVDTVFTFWLDFGTFGTAIPPDEWRIHDCYMDVTYVDGSVERLYAQTAEIFGVPSGLNAISHPERAIDGDPSSYCSIFRTNYGLSNPICLKIYGFA